jgi:hypothetical protein
MTNCCLETDNVSALAVVRETSVNLYDITMRIPTAIIWVGRAFPWKCMEYLLSQGRLKWVDGEDFHESISVDLWDAAEYWRQIEFLLRCRMAHDNFLSNWRVSELLLANTECFADVPLLPVDHPTLVLVRARNDFDPTWINDYWRVDLTPKYAAALRWFIQAMQLDRSQVPIDWYVELTAIDPSLDPETKRHLIAETGFFLNAPANPFSKVISPKTIWNFARGTSVSLDYQIIAQHQSKSIRKLKSKQRNEPVEFSASLQRLATNGWIEVVFKCIQKLARPDDQTKQLFQSIWKLNCASRMSKSKYSALRDALAQIANAAPGNLQTLFLLNDAITQHIHGRITAAQLDTVIDLFK